MSESAVMSMAGSRKKRSDSGVVRLQGRDLQALAWIEDQRAIGEKDLGVLLARLRGATDPIKRDAVMAVVRRWENLGLAKRRPNPWQGGVLVEVTQAGANLVTGTDRRVSPVALALINHTVALSHLRLAYEAQGWEWMSERTMHREGVSYVSPRTGELMHRGGIDPETGQRRGKRLDDDHDPDAIATSPSGQRVAIECELTAKQPARLDQIIRRLTIDLRWDHVHYWCSPEAHRAVTEAQRRVYDRINAGTLELPAGMSPKNRADVQLLASLDQDPGVIAPA